MKSKFNPAAFRRLDANIYKFVNDSLDQAAAKTVEGVDKNFRNKSFFGGRRWKPNTRNTPTLVKVGTLRDSVRVLNKTPNSRLVGTMIKYASLHNYGGIYTASKANGSRYTVNMPQRQFIGKSKVLDAQIQYILKRNFRKLIK